MQTVMRTRPHTLERDAMAPNMDGETDGDNVSVSGGSVGRGGTLDLDKIDEEAGVYTSFIVSVRTVGRGWDAWRVIRP